MEEGDKAMTRFELKKNTREVKHLKDIYKGCTFCQNEYFPEIIKPYDNKEDAMKALESYETEIQRLSNGAGTFYQVTEYYVEENVYDEDGEWESGGDVWEFSEIPESEDEEDED